MTTSSILKVIQHYQRSIEECQSDESRLLHCISKLYKLPVNVEHLQETGIGKTVNSLRKFNGEIGVAAKALVTKWKAMVTEEEPPAVDEHYPQGEGSGSGGSSEDDQCERNSASEMVEKRTNGVLPHANEKSKRSDSDSKVTDSEKSRSRSEKSSSKHKTSSSEASRSESRKHHSEESHKRKREEGKEKSTHHKDKKRDRGERESGSHSKDAQRKSSSSSEKKKEDSGHSKHHKSSKPDKSSEEPADRSKHTRRRDNNGSKSKEETDQPSSREKSNRSSEKPSTSTTGSPGKKRRHEEDNTATKDDHHKSKAPKSAKEKKEVVEEEPDVGIDSSMGANFADVLGMLDMPSKKSKSKTLNPLAHPTGPSTSTAALSSRPVNGVSSSKEASKHSHGGSSHSDRPSSSSSKRTSAVPDEKPDLLSDNAKLEPLDASIALALPAISTNYKPMPLNQTVMDCVFNNGSSSRPPPRSFNDAEALSHGISSKTMRTKIYSGVRTGQIHQVPSLFDLCIRVLQKNIDALEYTGGVPFEVLRPVLERATPQQLMIFEEYNPYVMEDSDVLWKAHVQRNYRVQKRQEMESWREMFIRCQEDQERKLSILAETIKQSQKIVAAPVRKTQLAFVDTMVKPPRNVQRKQEIHGTRSKLIATPAARVAALSSVTPNAAKTGDARLRVAASVRDAAQVSHSSSRPKKAPLMAKTLQFMRGRHKR